MDKIIECVPNFSEGRNQEIIAEIAEAIRNTEGVKLLDTDPGISTNRTVYTFVGSPEAVVEGAIAAAKIAYKRIDMRRHKGSHPRLGALDVCPFIPVANVTTEECITVSAIFGKRLAAEVGVPVYLYEFASSATHRKTLPQIRAGEYEGLQEKLKKTEWTPDFGPTEFIPSWGATVTGVRNFLIAYNINLIATKEQAHRIALNLREQGRGVDCPGRLRKCQAIGWYLEEKDLAQVSVNLTDFHVTPIHKAYEEAKKDAQELKLPVTGSEIVGLIPLAAILHAAEFYIEKEELFILGEEKKVMLAIDRLGLNSLSPFNPRERIIEYRIGEDRNSSWTRRSLGNFIGSVSARSAVPGGGCVAAAVGAMGAALGSMAGQLTYGKRQWEHLDVKMRQLIPQFYDTAIRLIPAIDADGDAFDAVMAASKLPHSTPEDSAKRDKALKDAKQSAIAVPLSLMENIDKLWEPLTELAKVVNINCKSDVQVCARCLEAAAWGGYYNILINNIEVNNKANNEVNNEVRVRAEGLKERAVEGCKGVLRVIEKS